MASINGVAIKGLKTFKDHEGIEAFQGNVVIDGKKAGHWSQDYHGGICDNFLFDTTELMKRVEECKAGLNGVMFQDVWDVESFMMNLVMLTMREKAYKASCKQGFSGKIYVYDGHYECSYPITETDHAKAVRNNEDIIGQMKADMKQDRKIGMMVCTSPDDFDLRVDASHPETTLLI